LPLVVWGCCKKPQVIEFVFTRLGQRRDCLIKSCACGGKNVRVALVLGRTAIGNCSSKRTNLLANDSIICC
jgi:hypothetical protein